MLVSRARALARELGFTHSSTPEVGRLLNVLAAQRGRTRVGELGTGCGVGAAWIVSVLLPEVPFVTVELDETLARASAELFAVDENVRVLHGDWHELMPSEAPFDLLFYDGGGKQHPDVDGDQVVGLLAPGATIVMDDLTPGRSGHDVVREFWLNHPELTALELLTTPETSVIVGTRSG
ncbi:MAG: O-methyltransferase [Gaiellaceae bacterium]